MSRHWRETCQRVSRVGLIGCREAVGRRGRLGACCRVMNRPAWVVNEARGLCFGLPAGSFSGALFRRASARPSAESPQRTGSVKKRFQGARLGPIRDRLKRSQGTQSRPQSTRSGARRGRDLEGLGERLMRASEERLEGFPARRPEPCFRPLKPGPRGPWRGSLRGPGDLRGRRFSATVERPRANSNPC